jgi:hypothetical protein
MHWSAVSKLLIVIHRANGDSGYMSPLCDAGGSIKYQPLGLNCVAATCRSSGACIASATGAEGRNARPAT